MSNYVTSHVQAFLELSYHHQILRACSVYKRGEFEVIFSAHMMQKLNQICAFLLGCKPVFILSWLDTNPFFSHWKDPKGLFFCRGQGRG